MFKFLRNKVPSEASESRPVPPSASQFAPSSIKPHADIQRELVRIVLTDTLRRNGIPSDWLACEAHTVADGPHGEELHIQLVLMHWNELLLRYARALELQLLRGLDRYEPTVDHTKKCTITWRISPDCGCPFSVMPPSVVWTHNATPAPRAEEPLSVLDRRQARRPPSTGASSSAAPLASSLPEDGRRKSDDPDDYERTQLSPLR
jgi:hypothetical protein